MSAAGVIPPPEERYLRRSGPVLTDWRVEGEIECPDCGRSFEVDCALEYVVRFTAVHDCPARDDT